MPFALADGMQQILEGSETPGILRVTEVDWLLRRLDYAATILNPDGDDCPVDLTIAAQYWECHGALKDLPDGEQELEIRFASGAFLVINVVLVGIGNVRRLKIGQINCPERRRFPRIQLPKGTLWLEYRCGLECLRYRVVDVSPFGMQVLGDNHQVYLKGRGRASLIDKEQSRDVCFEVLTSTGIEQRLHISSGRQDSSDHWFSQFYHQQRCPTIRQQKSEDLEQLRELFLGCGYMQLCRDQIDWTRWREFYPQGENNFNRVYTANSGEIVGHLSLSDFGHRCMVVHQLAVTNKGRLSANVRIQLYADAVLRCAEKMGPEGLLTSFLNPCKRWHQLFFLGFAQRMASPKNVDICYWDRYVWPTSSGHSLTNPHPQGTRSLDIVELEEAQMHGLRRSIIHHSSELNEQFLVSCMTSSGSQGSDRDHNQDNGDSLPVGKAYRCRSKEESSANFYLLCVSTPANLSLFGLFNQIWIVPEPDSMISSSNTILEAIKWIRSTLAEKTGRLPMIFAPPGFLHKQLSDELGFVERVGCFFLKSKFAGQVYRFLEFQKTRLLNQTQKRSSTMNNGTELFESYQRQMEATRLRLKNHPLFALIESEECTRGQLLRLLIKHSAHAQFIVRPVESWILEASRRCREIGMVRMSEYFKRHSKEEAGHEKMLENDLVFLIELWNACCYPPMSVEQTKCDSISSGMLGFIDLHERTLRSPYPHMQIAMEYEIELLSVLLIPSVLSQTRRLLGQKVVDNLSFLSSHLNLDVFHTKANEKVFIDLLVERPNDIDRLVQAGQQVLNCYSEIFDQFVVLAGNYIDIEIQRTSTVARETAKQLLS